MVGFSRDELISAVTDEILGYGPIEPLLQDPAVSEVMVNGPDTVYFEKEGRLYLSPIRFRDPTHIIRIIERVLAPLGRRVDESSPMVDARLPDGSRVNIIVPPVSPRSPTITIRKFRSDKMTMDDLVGVGSFTPDLAEFIRACVQAKLNLLISGGTGSGKTTLLNALSGYISDAERIVTIEDPTELKLQQNHVVTLEARPASLEGRGEVTQRDLVRNSLRMRPDRIIVGEVRGPEAFDMMQAMNTGHEGSVSTVHANSPRDALARIENMIPDGQPRPTLTSNPGTDLIGREHDHPDFPHVGRHAKAYSCQRSRRHGRRSRDHAGTSLSSSRPASMARAWCKASSNRPVFGRSSPSVSRAWASTSRPAFSLVQWPPNGRASSRRSPLHNGRHCRRLAGDLPPPLAARARTSTAASGPSSASQRGLKSQWTSSPA